MFRIAKRSNSFVQFPIKRYAYSESCLKFKKSNSLLILGSKTYSVVNESTSLVTSHSSHSLGKEKRERFLEQQTEANVNQFLRLVHFLIN